MSKTEYFRFTCTTKLILIEFIFFNPVAYNRIILSSEDQRIFRANFGTNRNKSFRQTGLSTEITLISNICLWIQITDLIRTR
ncbi:hypothetical protein LR61_18160 [Morganella morganii]|nr:hypothetical protein LR61_18160 [Morganella morganii]